MADTASIVSIDSTPSRLCEADLLLRYDSAGPRYTSYPTAPQFRADFGETRYREHARRSNATFSPRPLSLYVHVPFCASPCFYCGCSRLITRDVTGARHIRERGTRRDSDGTKVSRELEELSALIGTQARHERAIMG